MADRVDIPGSEKPIHPNASVLATSAPEEPVTVTLRLRHKIPAEGTTVMREDYEANYTATPEDAAKVAEFAGSHGLEVVESSLPRSTVVVKGTAQQIEAAFAIKLETHQVDGFSYRARSGPITVPSALGDIITAVMGVDNRPQAQPHFRRVQGNVAHSGGALTGPSQLAALYNFPKVPNGPDQTIALIELGGGFSQADINSAFTRYGLPAPNVKAVSVDGGSTTARPGDGATGEVMLDVLWAAGAYTAATGKPATIVIYFAPNTDSGFLDAITTAIHDSVNKPSVISISWGSQESNWTAQARTQFDQAFQVGSSLGVTSFAASGDNGSSDGGSSNNVDFPSSSPNCVGCGGTRLTANGNTIVSETVWNDGQGGATGGGLSTVFPKPSWQTTSSSQRSVPDISGDADPATGYPCIVDGSWQVIGGTSAVAPVMAGLTAVLNRALGKNIGALNPLIWTNQPAFRDITQGNNGAFAAKTGPDQCTGVGVPDGTKLLAALSGAAPPVDPPPVNPPPVQPPTQPTISIPLYLSRPRRHGDKVSFTTPADLPIGPYTFSSAPHTMIVEEDS